VDVDNPTSLSWHFPLFEYQLAGIRRLISEPDVLLADEMGLGKTIQAIGALRMLLRNPDESAALILVPATLVLQWRRQLRDWAPELALSTSIGGRDERMARWRSAARVYLTSYDALIGDLTLPAPYGPRQRRWSVVIADEAQRIRNAHTLIAAAVKSLPRMRSWALTGTPLENSAEDTVSILDFVSPGAYDSREMLAGLRRTLRGLQLRRRRADVLPDLPPKSSCVLHCDMTPVQRAAYDAAEHEGRVWLRSLGAEVRVAHVLELILRLKQICNVCPRSGESGKLEDLYQRLAGIVPEQKVLVFSQFVAEPFGAEAIAAALAPLRPLLLTGRMPQSARDAVLAAFISEPAHRVLVASLRTGGVGLNLTAASVVIHFDRWWNPAVEAQAEDRAHRIGQTRPVHAFAYLTSNSIEQRIADILAEKRELFADIVDGVEADALRRLDLPTLLRAVGLQAA
jgi:SNF2 family DNA or RNA helicase